MLGYIIIAALLESVASFSGAAIAIVGKNHVKKFAHNIIGFAIGALLAVSLLELLPEALESADASIVFPVVLIGVLMFFVLEKLMYWHRCHRHEHETDRAEKEFGYLILWGDLLHNFIDGVIIALAFMADTTLGITTTVAVLLHEIPQELADFGVLMHAGFTKRKAFFYNFLISLATLVGALLAYFLGDLLTDYMPLALALVAGNFIYLAMVDLLPELHGSTKIKNVLQEIFFILIGIALVSLPHFFFAEG